LTPTTRIWLLPDGAHSSTRSEVNGRVDWYTAIGRILSLIFGEVRAPGARLPSKRIFAARLGVSLTTLRDALATLEAE
jgi:DNA-binding FadR family transcriptional regulator